MHLAHRSAQNCLVSDTQESLTSETAFSVCKNRLANDLDESSSEDWDHVVM